MQRDPLAGKLPVTLITGFLGSGKTTLIQALLRHPAMNRVAVVINEVGEIGIDHDLVTTVSENVSLLANGCLCCTVRGDLVNTLEKLLRGLDNGRMNFNRVIIETTGLADPAPVLHTAMAHPYLVMRYRLDGVEAVVDAVSPDEPPFSLFSAFGDASAFSAAAFFPPSDFGALPLSPFG